MGVDPKKWIYDFIDHTPGIIRTPARWIADRIFGALSDGVSFARWLKGGFQYLYVKGVYYAQRATGFVTETVTTIEWLITVELPRRALDVLNKARAYTAGLINSARNGLLALINNVWAWATREINKLRALADNILGWASREINKIKDVLGRTVYVWADRLTHPDKMAAWLIGALVGPAWRYGYAHRDKIITWALRTSPAFTVWLARQLDDILGRLL